MLPVTAEAVRVFLHVLAAAVWVGGQVALAGVVGALRPAGPEAVSAVARRFQVVAWPAFFVLVVTGVWNLMDVGWSDATSEWQATLMAKLGLVLLSGAGALAHSMIGARNRALSGAAAGVGLLAALGALFLGVLLHG